MQTILTFSLILKWEEKKILWKKFYDFLKGKQSLQHMVQNSLERVSCKDTKGVKLA